MSTQVIIQQDFSINLTFLKNFLTYQDLFFGIYNQNYCLERYQGNEDITNQYLILVRKDIYGRGMSFFLHNNQLELTLNSPSSPKDIDMFYRFINDYCLKFNIPTLLHDGKEYDLDKIDILKHQALSLNQQFIKNFLKAETTIFGAIYPISLEQSLIDEIKKVDKEKASLLFEAYLDQKQKMSLDYATALIYQTKEKNHYIAKYALTKDVPTIFPYEPYLPYSYPQDLLPSIKEWSIVLIDQQKIIGEMPFSYLWKVFNKNKCPKFDAKHAIITLTDQELY